MGKPEDEEILDRYLAELRTVGYWELRRPLVGEGETISSLAPKSGNVYRIETRAFLDERSESIWVISRIRSKGLLRSLLRQRRLWLERGFIVSLDGSEGSRSIGRLLVAGFSLSLIWR